MLFCQYQLFHGELLIFFVLGESIFSEFLFPDFDHRIFYSLVHLIGLFLVEE